MSVAGQQDTKVVEADKAWSIERHALEPIPLSDRHGSPMELFRMWIGANVNYVVLLTGAIAVNKGLGLWGSLSAILVGNLLGCLVLGLSSIMGSKTGSSGVVTSRTSFGQMGAILPILISTISALGWFSINSVIATDSLAQLFVGAGLPDSPALPWISLLIVLCAEILLAIYGHATIIAVEKYLAVILVVMFAGVAIIVLPQIDWAVAMTGRSPQTASFGTWLIVMGLIFSYPISWTNFASDYSRYLHPGTSWWSITKAAGGGQFVSLVFCELVGVFFAIAIGTVLSENPVADLPKILPLWYLTPFLIAIIIGSIAANVPNGYTAGLGLLGLRLPLGRVNSLLVIAAATLVFRVVTLLYGEFLGLYQQWLDYINFWTCPWIAVVVVDYFLRKGSYSGPDLMRWGGGKYWYQGGVFWPGLTAFFVGLVLSFAFANSEVYASPLMVRYFGGTDLSFEVGLLSSAIIYYALAKARLKARV